MEVWAFDEHRLGLKPIIRKVWSPKGERPVAMVHHRYQWTYLYGFVHPASGETEWFIVPRVNVEWMNEVLKAFAQTVGASATHRILLVLDGAGWHRSQKLEIPEGIHLEILPPYSPELQPAERLWSIADEPLVNQCFQCIEEVEEILAERCRTISTTMKASIQGITQFHWWPA